jgi:hypothetical protein
MNYQGIKITSQVTQAVPTMDEFLRLLADTQRAIESLIERIEWLEKLHAGGDDTPEPKPQPKPVDPVPLPPPGSYPNYESLLNHPDFVDAISYRSQAEIDSRTVNAAKNPSGSNESVVYDPQQDAASLNVASSLTLWNRCQLKFEPVKTGILTCIWEYKPSKDWLGNNDAIRTHKMFMTGSWLAKDRRTLEQRFHYATAAEGTWRCDTRPYWVGTSEGNLGRIEPYNETFVDVDQWHRFTSIVDFTKEVPEYTVYANDHVMYDAVPLPTLIPNQQSLDFFDPTWCNTSQSAGDNPNRIHGWLRNAVVLWNKGK